MCLWLVEREGYEGAEHLGTAGSEQGCDIVAWREGARWAFQCKRVQRFGPRDALEEVEKVLGRPGRGKSAYFKQQIDLLVTLAHRVFVVDIEGEYRALCDDVGGVYLEFSRTAENHLNILDLNHLANDPFGAGMSTLMGFLTVVLRQAHRHACHEPRHEYSRWYSQWKYSRWQDRH